MWIPIFVVFVSTPIGQMSHDGKPRMRSILSCGISTLSEGYNTA